MEKEEKDMEKLHMLSHEIFDDISDKTHKYLETTLDSTVEKNKVTVADEDDHFDVIISPMMSAHAAVLANYLFLMGYSKGDVLEMFSDFYDQARESEEDNEDEDCGNPDCEVHGKKAINDKIMN